jgi:putative peptide zinc metalloprotease protein
MVEAGAVRPAPRGPGDRDALVLTVIPALALLLVAIVMAFPRVAATAWDSVRSRWEILEPTWRTEGAADAAVVLLSIVLVLLPVAGATYLVGRVVRRLSLRVWSGTRGRPVLRTLALVGAVAGVVALGWAWWPDGQYRPIEAEDRGTAFDLAGAVPIESAADEDEAEPVAVPPGASPQLAFVLTSPDAPEAAPIVVLIPADVDLTDPEWPFPFDPPAPPDGNDNQALAVNTEDASTVYEVSISVVWVTEGPVDTTNEAWALANCLNCETVAVAYQAVFVVDGTAAVVPENIAVAVNYRCGECETTALAGQLVVTLTGLPSDEAMAELVALQAELEALEDGLTEMSLGELYEELERIEAEFVSVLIDDGALELSEAITVEASASASPSPSPSPEATVTASPSPAPTESPSPTATESPSPSEPTETTSPTPAP